MFICLTANQHFHQFFPVSTPREGIDLDRGIENRETHRLLFFTFKEVGFSIELGRGRLIIITASSNGEALGNFS